MAPPALKGVLETCLYVSDVGRSRAFYADVLGLEPMGGSDRIQPFAVRDGQVLILFRKGGTAEPVDLDGGTIPPHDGGGEQHFAFGIDRHDFDTWLSYLEARGIAIESVVDWPAGGKSLYFRDPDRLLVELVTQGVWKNY